MLEYFRTHIAARLATIWLVVAIPMTVMVFATYGAWYTARQSIIEQQREGYAESTAKSFQLLLLKLRFELRTSGANLAEDGPPYRSAESVFSRIAAAFPVADVVLTDTRGRVLSASDADLVGRSLAQDAAFRVAMRAPDGSGIEPSEDASRGVVGFHVAQLIPARPGRPPRVMMALVDVRRLHQTFTADVPTGGISVVDSAGQVVFQNEDIRFAANRAQWGDKFGFVRDALRGQQAAVRNWRFPLGGSRIGVFVPIEPIGWAAGSSVAPAVALAPFYRARIVGIPILLAVALLSLLTSVRISRGIRRSLEQLEKDAHRIGAGQLEEPVDTTREDEIGHVARSLEAARIELSDARQHAEQLLAEEQGRTRFGRSMAEINADLASSLDIDVTLPGVLRKACEELRGVGAIVSDRVEGGWRVRLVAGLPESDLGPGAFFDDQHAPTSTHVLKSSGFEPFVVEDIQSAPEVNRSFGASSGFAAWAVYPLVVRGELTGVLSVFFAEPHPFSEVERDYLRRIAFAISLSEENSRLYASEHRIAETLQTALLALPERLPGIDFACMYHSATETARVGGDFYDLFELGHDRVGITIGDISGHGVDAAVLTSLVKNAIRVQATEENKHPNEVMANANRILYDNSPNEIFATVFFGVLDLRTGALEFCSAGHPTGACVGPNGCVRRLSANSPLIGAFPEEEFGLSTEHVGECEMLFLYTDGLTEARRGSEFFGEERLFELLAQDRGGEPEQTLRRVVDAVLEFSGGELRDDLAILVVQRGDEVGR